MVVLSKERETASRVFSENLAEILRGNPNRVVAYRAPLVEKIRGLRLILSLQFNCTIWVVHQKKKKLLKK
jgi:hypothetical protein